jgi:predicted acylesterase/phospholipase RssA
VAASDISCYQEQGVSDADVNQEDRTPSLTVALSGGGHRAALFGLGVLLYLADVGRNIDVTSIASVSGGSITNGYLAQHTSYNRTDAEQIQRTARELASTIANQGSLMGPRFSALVLGTTAVFLAAGWIALGLDAGLVLRAGLGSVLGLIAGIVLATLFRGWLPRLYIALIGLSLFWALGGPWVLPVPAAVRFLLTLLALALWIWIIAARRSWVCEWAYERTFFSPGGHPTLLRETSGELDHVLCATELQSSEQLYFAKDFVYGYRYGVGSPGEMTLARAVQASACLPFAFAPRWFRRADYGFSFPREDVPPVPDRAKDTRFVVLTDGGVYDNMGDEWAFGFPGRKSSWPELASRGREPTHAIIVNASAGKGWDAFPPSVIPGWGELSGVLRIKDVLYDQTTAPRRRALVAAFNQAAAARAAAEHSGVGGASARVGLLGALVDIGQSPFDVPNRFVANPALPEQGGRAKAALEELGDTKEIRKIWDDRQRESARIGTVLSRLGSEVSARLLHHAYVLAAVNLHVILNFPLPRPLPGVDRFRALVAKEKRRSEPPAGEGG